MFVHRPATRSVWFVPWREFLAGACLLALAAFAAWDATDAGEPPVLPVLLLGALGVICGGFGVAALRRIRVQDGVVRVRSVRGVRALPLAEVAIGFRVRGTSRTVRTELYATTGDELLVLGAGRFTPDRAQAHADRLAATLQTGPGTPRARQLCAETAAPARQTQAAIDAFYRAPKWRRSGRILLVILVLYLLIMLPLVWLGNAHGFE